MQVMQAQPPDLKSKDIARRLFIRLAAESSADMLPLCKQIAELEERKQMVLARLAECPGRLNGEIARLITQQQSSLAQIMGKERDSRP